MLENNNSLIACQSASSYTLYIKYVFEFQIYYEVININDMKFNKHTIRRFVVLDKCFTRSPQTLHSEAPSILSHREKYVHTGLFLRFVPDAMLTLENGNWNH